VIVILLHAGLAIAIKILFFAHGSPAAKPKDDAGDDDKGNAMRMMMGL
jgi:protein YIPF1/2